MVLYFPHTHTVMVNKNKTTWKYWKYLKMFVVYGYITGCKENMARGGAGVKVKVYTVHLSRWRWKINWIYFCKLWTFANFMRGACMQILSFDNLHRSGGGGDKLLQPSTNRYGHLAHLARRKKHEKCPRRKLCWKYLCDK